MFSSGLQANERKMAAVSKKFKILYTFSYTVNFDVLPVLCQLGGKKWYILRTPGTYHMYETTPPPPNTIKKNVNEHKYIYEQSILIFAGENDKMSLCPAKAAEIPARQKVWVYPSHHQ